MTGELLVVVFMIACSFHGPVLDATGCSLTISRWRPIWTLDWYNGGRSRPEAKALLVLFFHRSARAARHIALGRVAVRLLLAAGLCTTVWILFLLLLAARLPRWLLRVVGIALIRHWILL